MISSDAWENPLRAEDVFPQSFPTASSGCVTGMWDSKNARFQDMALTTQVSDRAASRISAVVPLEIPVAKSNCPSENYRSTSSYLTDVVCIISLITVGGIANSK